MRNLMYLDLSGRPRPRKFVVAALLLVGLITAMTLWSDHPTKQRLVSTPGPVISGRSPRAQAEGGDRIKPVTTQEPEPSHCPHHPEDWKFVEIFPEDRYMRIEPACVYDGIALTAAWMLMERMGYSKPEAAELLALAEMPWVPSENGRVFTNYQGPLEISLGMDWPAHPAFFFWQLDREGRPGVTISLRGCFVVVDEAKCILALDRPPGSAVSVLGEYQITSHASDLPGTRSFYLIEYLENVRWVLKGQLTDLTIPHDESVDYLAEREAIAARLGVETWSAAWLSTQYGIMMKPLPASWRLFRMDADAMQGIATELNRYLGVEEGGEDDE